MELSIIIYICISVLIILSFSLDKPPTELPVFWKVVHLILLIVFVPIISIFIAIFMIFKRFREEE